MITVEEIRHRYESGEDMRFLYFWGHSAKSGKITKACLSQWYPCNFRIDEITYHTAEQYMMACKARLFGDDEVCAKIMEADNPRDYKTLGRQIRGFDQQIWDAEKLSIVIRGNLAKFSQNQALMEYILGTGDAIIVEASPYDDIWGVKLAMGDMAIRNPLCWKGQNLLGCALIETRNILRERIKNMQCADAVDARK